MQPDIRIGDLRWQVTLANRSHVSNAFDDADVVLAEKFDNHVDVFAKITPVGTQTFLAGVQTEINGITHRITIRWRPFMDKFSVVRRTVILLPGSTREEIYRIHRVAEWQGRNRFLIIDAELEKFS